MNFDAFITILTAFASGLTHIVGTYIWHPPQALLFLCLVYFLQFLGEILLIKKEGKLIRLKGIQIFLEMSGHVAGATIILFILHNFATWIIGFDLLGLAVYSILSSLVSVGVVKVYSKLNWLPIYVSQFLEKRIQKILEKNEEDNQKTQ